MRSGTCSLCALLYKTVVLGHNSFLYQTSSNSTFPYASKFYHQPLLVNNNVRNQLLLQCREEPTTAEWKQTSDANASQHSTGRACSITHFEHFTISQIQFPVFSYLTGITCRRRLGSRGGGDGGEIPPLYCCRLLIETGSITVDPFYIMQPGGDLIDKIRSRLVHGTKAMTMKSTMIHRITLDLKRSLVLSLSFVARDGGQLTILGTAFDFTCSACCLLDFHRLLSISLSFFMAT